MKHCARRVDLICNTGAGLDCRAFPKATVVVVAHAEVHAELAEFDAVLNVGTLFMNGGCAMKLQERSAPSQVVLQQGGLVSGICRVTRLGTLTGRGQRKI